MIFQLHISHAWFSTDITFYFWAHEKMLQFVMDIKNPCPQNLGLFSGLPAWKKYVNWVYSIQYTV